MARRVERIPVICVGAEPPPLADRTLRVIVVRPAAAKRALDGAPRGVAVFNVGEGVPSALIAHARARGWRVIAVAAAGDARVVMAVEAGAHGCVVHDDLARAIHSVYEGGAPVSHALAGPLLERLRRAGTNGELLTVREREIAELFATGATYADVARALDISINTVRQHVRNVYEKLDVASKAQLVARVRGE